MFQHVTSSFLDILFAFSGERVRSNGLSVSDYRRHVAERSQANDSVRFSLSTVRGEPENFSNLSTTEGEGE